MAWALLGFLIYAVVGWTSKNLYPFSRYSMYASVPLLSEGSIPAFRVNGHEARLSDYTDFHGLDPDALWNPRWPCTLEWMTHEARRWIAEHPAPPGDTPPVEVEWGRWHVQIDPSGTASHRFEAIAVGRARLR